MVHVLLPNYGKSTPHGLRMDVAMISPQDAERMLEKNTHNRKITPSRVESLAQSIERGEFTLTGEPIIFGRDGTLLDGQHRLHACVMADTAIITAIIYGVDPAAFAAMGFVKARTASEVLGIDGKDNSAVLAGATRAMVLFESGVRSINRSLSNVEIVTVVQRTPELVMAANIVSSDREFRIMSKVSGLAAGFAMILRANSTLAHKFINELRTGANLPEGRATLTLRNRLISAKARGEKMTTIDVATLLIKAWNKWLRNESVMTLRFSSNETLPQVLAA